MTASHQRAILAALSHNWKEALEENQAILAEDPDDIETLNRLTYAYIQVGEMKKARSLCKKVLDLDRYNSIAIKNLQKIKLFQGMKRKNDDVHLGKQDMVVSPGLFLEEPGRTKLIQLVNVAPKSVLCTLVIGDLVVLVAKKHTLEARKDKTYLGALPDDLGFRLSRLIKYGNQYQAYIRSIGKNAVTVFIKEVKRSKRFKNQPTFPASSDLSFYSYSHYALPPSSTEEERVFSDADSEEESEE